MEAAATSGWVTCWHGYLCGPR